ncbi:MAG: hypothetical protein NTZ25_00655 [Candidatus Peregrinibacteria bacterium]|nr:hypothetical protein [Candidatus Peregrinibacteria bacterium]
MKKYKIIISIGLMLLINNSVAYADPATQDSNGNLSVARCIQKGNIDFLAFLKTLISADSFKEGIVEPWNDILSRNQCQSNDVYTLIKQEDKIRSSIRDAFLTCNNQAVPQLKKAYQKIMVEIYYARHIVDTGLLGRLPVPAHTSVFRDAAVVPRDQIYNDMMAKYVSESFMTQAEFDLLFLKLESKYSDRKSQYLECTKSPWEEVGKKWNELVKFFKDDAAGLKDAGKAIGADGNGKGPSLWNEMKTIKFVELFTTDESVFEYVKSFGQVTVNGTTATNALDEAKNYLDTHITNGSGLTQSQYANITTSAQEQYIMEKDISQVRADFDSKYKSAADGGMEQFINALDGRQTGGADDGTLEIIETTFSPLNQVLSLTTKIKDRQCKE